MWWGASLARLDKVTADSRLGARLSGRDQRIGTSPRRLAGEFDAVIWATGYRTDHAWIDVPAAKDQYGRISHIRGVTSSPGLYLLGLSWQHTRGSALLGWVGGDAAFLTGQITALPGRGQRR